MKRKKKKKSVFVALSCCFRAGVCASMVLPWDFRKPCWGFHCAFAFMVLPWDFRGLSWDPSSFHASGSRAFMWLSMCFHGCVCAFIDILGSSSVLPWCFHSAFQVVQSLSWCFHRMLVGFRGAFMVISLSWYLHENVRGLHGAHGVFMNVAGTFMRLSLCFRVVAYALSWGFYGAFMAFCGASTAFPQCF